MKGGGTIGGGKGSGDRKGGEGQGSGDGGGGGSKGKPPIAIFDTRSPSNVDRPDYREIYFTPEKSCKAEIKIEEVGADQAFPLKVKKVKWRSGKVENGNIIIDMKENERVHLKVFFVEDFLGALRIVAHEV